MSDELEPSSTRTEQLVAYLDGELPEGAARDVEKSLANDPTVRAEVEQLNRAWELLDLLQRPTISADFSSRTLATLHTADVPAEIATELESAPTVVLKRWQATRFGLPLLVAWAAGLFLVSVLSFVVARQVARPGTDPLFDDLPVIENLEVYRELGDVEFVRELQRKGLLDDHRPRDPR